MSYLSTRREFVFLYDIKMGNPNGDPDENRPRVLPDGTFYVTDVRLKRFIRDYFKNQGRDILVDTVEGKTTNLTGRVAAYLQKQGKPQCQGKDLVDILLQSFIDARLFGSSFAFAPEKEKSAEEEDDTETPATEALEAEKKSAKSGKKGNKKESWDPKPEPKTLTGAVQINHGEVLHKAQEVDIYGTSIFGSQEGKSQGTFTTYFGLRYALIGFSGVANEHSAAISHMTDEDYNDFLLAMWNSVRSSGNTRTKVGQLPRFLASVAYHPKEEFQCGRLCDYIHPKASSGKPEKEWSGPDDYILDLSRFLTRLQEWGKHIAEVSYCLSPDVQIEGKLPESWKKLGYD